MIPARTPMMIAAHGLYKSSPRSDRGKTGNSASQNSNGSLDSFSRIQEMISQVTIAADAPRSVLTNAVRSQGICT